METVCVLEAVTAGLCGEVPRSLWREGTAMRTAAVAMLRRTGRPVVSPVVRDGRLWLERDGETVEVDDWRVAFQEGLDAGLVIAPETGGMLCELLEEFAAAGVATPGNCSPKAVEVLGDKLATFRRFGAACGFVPTADGASLGLLPAAGRYVVKPRDGAGTGFRLVDRPAAGPGEVCQPYVEGEARSATALAVDGEAWPVLETRQRLVVRDGVGAYAGGESVPTETPLPWSEIVALPGVAGWVGVDFVLTCEGPRVVDVNPRLTTSVLGLSTGFEIDLLARASPVVARFETASWAVGSE